MAQRYTKAFLGNRFKYAAKAVGWDIAPHWESQGEGKGVKARVGAVFLDHYQGWTVTQIWNEGGAENHLNGHCNRYTASELVAFLDGVTLGAETVRKEMQARIDALHNALCDNQQAWEGEEESVKEEKEDLIASNEALLDAEAAIRYPTPSATA
jgi:hypothetical protein